MATQVLLWAYEPETVQEINELHTNERFLPSASSRRTGCQCSPGRGGFRCRIDYLVVPSQWLRSTAKLFAGLLAPQVIVVNAEGLDNQSLKPLSKS